MKLVAGLGNIGPRFEGTRHNAGFDALDLIAAACGVRVKKYLHQGFYAIARIGGEETVLVKPATYMNASGECVSPIARRFGVSPSDTLIIHDDINLPLASVRIRKGGSAGGHNGMKSVIACMQTQEVPRLRIGIGAPSESQIDFVLSRFGNDERILIEEALERAARAAAMFVEEGADAAMNRFNGKEGAGA